MGKPRAIHNCAYTAFLNEHKVAVAGIFLAVVILGLSLFLTIYSNYLINSRVAEVNADTYARQANISSGEEQQVYKEIANKWHDAYQDFRTTAKSRAYSADMCLFSLIVLICMCVLFPKEKLYWWFVPLLISFGFLVWSFLIYRFNWGYSWLDPISTALFGITP
jgi:hypothetical protein